jgi:hypothetical protein
LQENVFIYAVNEVAQRGIDLAQSDTSIKQMMKPRIREQRLLLLQFTLGDGG